MAVTQNPHIGRSRNAFATAVFSTWKGRNVMRGKPISVHNPDSPEQKKQRGAFGATVQLWTRDLSVHKRGFNSFASRMTEVNAFVQQNINKSVSSNTSGDIVTDFEKLVLSLGPLPQALDLDVTVAANKYTVSWDGNPLNYLPNQAANDTLSLALIVQLSDGTFTVTNYLDIAQRDANTYDIPDNIITPAGGAVYVIPYFWSSNNRMASDSVVFEFN